jgi:putative endonuclease
VPTLSSSGDELAQSWYTPAPTCNAIVRSVDVVSEDARQRLGAIGERLAAEHLERLGFEIVERNFRTRWGELDIVAFDGEVLAFCEVKTRRFGPRGGMALEAVRPHKQRQVRRMAFSWLRERTDRPYARELRFDAIGVTFDLQGRLVGIEHLEAAF